MMSGGERVFTFLFVLALITVLFIAGTFAGASGIRADAIEHGVGKWTVDAKTGDTKFEWIECPGT